MSYFDDSCFIFGRQGKINTCEYSGLIGPFASASVYAFFPLKYTLAADPRHNKMTRGNNIIYNINRLYATRESLKVGLIGVW